MHINISMGVLDAILQRTIIQKRVMSTKIIPTLCLVNNEPSWEIFLDLHAGYVFTFSFLGGKDGIQRHVLLHHIIWDYSWGKEIGQSPWCKEWILYSDTDPFMKKLLKQAEWNKRKQFQTFKFLKKLEAFPSISNHKVWFHNVFPSRIPPKQRLRTKKRLHTKCKKIPNYIV